MPRFAGIEVERVTVFHRIRMALVVYVVVSSDCHGRLPRRQLPRMRLLGPSAEGTSDPPHLYRPRGVASTDGAKRAIYGPYRGSTRGTLVERYAAAVADGSMICKAYLTGWCRLVRPWGQKLVKCAD